MLNLPKDDGRDHWTNNVRPEKQRQFYATAGMVISIKIADSCRTPVFLEKSGNGRGILL